MIHICDHNLLIFNLLLIMSVVACEMKILTFTAYKGGTVEIRCPYESKYETHNKYLCRGECPYLHNKDIPVESGSAAKDERFSLTDNRTTHIFTVTITDLRTEDQGQYWCAVRTGILKTDLYTEIHLEIKNVTSESPKPTTTASDHSRKPATADTASNRAVTSICPSSSATSSSSAIFMLSSSNNAVLSKPEPGFAMILMLMVVGILTGFGFSLFMYFRWRQKKEGNQRRDDVQGPTEHLPNRDDEPIREVAIYENISDTLDHLIYSSVLPVFDEHNASVYALAQLPSSPSDNLTYSTIKFPATPHSDRTSDGQETCDYTTVTP